jgi:septation ring formation regulator EzrA
MTIIRREYIPQTREFKYKSGNTGGVVNDSNSTTIIVDFPEGYLDDKDAFIAFNVLNPGTGQPYWYDFSACSIEIPYEVASKVIQNKLDYQLILIGKDNPNYVEQSSIDTALFMRSIQDYPQIAGSPIPAVVELDMLRYRQSQTVIDALDEIKEYIRGLYEKTGGGSEGEIDATYLDNKFSELHEALVQLELPNLSSAISSLSSDVQNVQSSVDNVPMRIADSLSIPDYSSDLSELGSSIENIENSVSTINSTVSNLPQEVGQYITIPDHSAILDEVQSGISTISSDVTNISTNTATVMSEVADVKNRVDSVNNGISGVSETVAGTASMVSNLSEDFQTTSSEISSIHTEMSELPSRVAEAIIIPDYTFTLNKIDSGISSLSSSIDGVSSNINTIETDIGTIHNDITGLGEMMNTTLGSPTTSVSNQLENLYTEITSQDSGSIKGECRTIQDKIGETSLLAGSTVSAALSSLLSGMDEIFRRLDNIESTLSNMGGNP